MSYLDDFRRLAGRSVLSEAPLTLKSLAATYPDFEVKLRGVIRGQRSYDVVHKPSGYWAACTLRKLDTVEDLIRNFEKEKHLIQYWRPAGQTGST